MSHAAGPVLLYDGVCGFCDRTVRMILSADRGSTFRFAPLEGDFARGVIARHPILRGIDSLVLVEPGKGGAADSVHVRSGALLRTARYLGGPWRLMTVLALIPRPLRDWAYDVFARRRYRIFGRFEACPVPPPDVRGRYLE